MCLIKRAIKREGAVFTTFTVYVYNSPWSVPPLCLQIFRKGLFRLSQSESENFLWCLPFDLWSFSPLFSLSSRVNSPLRRCQQNKIHLWTESCTNLDHFFVFFFRIMKHVGRTSAPSYWWYFKTNPLISNNSTRNHRKIPTLCKWNFFI